MTDQVERNLEAEMAEMEHAIELSQLLVDIYTEKLRRLRGEVEKEKPRYLH